MGLGRTSELTRKYKANVYSITLDVSGWDRIGFHIEAPVAAPVYVYGSNDAGAGQGITDGNATLATNFTPIQGTNLATSTKVSSMNAAGVLEVDVNTRFIRLQGGAADVYRLYMYEAKTI